MSEKMSKVTAQIRDLQKDVKELQLLIQKQTDKFAEMLSTLDVKVEQLINLKKSQDNSYKVFPLQTEEDLQSFNTKLSNEEEQQCAIAIIKNILTKGGLAKNFFSLFSKTIINEFNCDGFQKKKAFKLYANIDNVLFKAMQDDVITFDLYKREIKRAFKFAKNKIYKEKCLSKTANTMT
ncbi:uncharacterized protein LOC142226441 [Haematobia irritans]|uniref:uncharacterized protein LOC142226441 n=1 Tax=Haematobia irritans TaxID=7368 RepID=UPI003F5022C7